MPRKTTPNDLNSVGVAVAARVLGVSRQTIHNWAETGRMRLYPMRGKLGRTGEPARRVMRSDLERLLKQRRAKT